MRSASKAKRKITPRARKAQQKYTGPMHPITGERIGSNLMCNPNVNVVTGKPEEQQLKALIEALPFVSRNMGKAPEEAKGLIVGFMSEIGRHLSLALSSKIPVLRFRNAEEVRS